MRDRLAMPVAALLTVSCLRKSLKIGWNRTFAPLWKWMVRKCLGRLSLLVRRSPIG